MHRLTIVVDSTPYHIDDDATFIIGRAEECTLTLEDESVSRRHAAITFAEGRFSVTNLSQTNPLVVVRGEDKQVLPHNDNHTLQAEDAIYVGLVRVEVTLHDSIQSNFKVRCTNCNRTLSPRLSDCPWCGTSLAFAQSIFVGGPTDD